MRCDNSIQLNSFISILDEFELNPSGGRSGTLEILKKEVEHRWPENDPMIIVQ